ncbi:MAG: SIS domain-containing protein [Candidatus Saelkia tenebricola]|nr:SIS domain-containing protein [Candidatus Saelkia tenebricola]
MKEVINNYFQNSINVKKDFLKQHIDKIEQAAEKLISIFQSGGKMLVFGNGGSAADSQHIAAELVGRFRKERRALPVLALTTNTSILTAVANDYAYEDVFLKQIEAFLKPGDCVMAISTSGNSANVIKAVEFTKAMGGFVISLTGCEGGRIVSISDISFVVASDEVSIIQEVHITLAHLLCLLVEESLY